jgi:hypothetical protein
MCQRRLTGRRGTFLRYTKLPEERVIRIIKYLGHGFSVEAMAEICNNEPRAVDRLLERVGRRAEDFHCLELDKFAAPLVAVQLDERDGRVSPTLAKKGGAAGQLRSVAVWVGSVSTRP